MGRKLAGPLILLLASYLGAEVYRIDDLGGGMRENVPGHRIADNEATSIVNMHVNPYNNGLEQRGGSHKQNVTQLSGSSAVDLFNHVQIDGDQFTISFASKTVAYSIDNGASWTTLVTTMTINSVWDGVSFADDNFYMVNQNNGGWYFNGTGFLTAGSMPSAKYLESYQNRLFAGYTSATPYRLFFSGLLQGTTWNTALDYIDFPEAINCIGPPFDGGLPVYTKNTTWMLRGSAPTDFYLQQISDGIGCADNRSVQNVDIGGNEYQVFLSLGKNSSKKNIYGLTGTSIVPIGDDVSNTIGTISMFDTSNKDEVWDTQSDFILGTTSNTSTALSIDSVVLSTWTDIDESSTDFSAGTIVALDTVTTPGRLEFDYIQNLNNNSFETTSDSWTFSGWSQTSGVVYDGLKTSARNAATSVTSLVVEILNTSDSVLTSSTYSLTNDLAWHQIVSMSMAPYGGQDVKIQYHNPGLSTFVRSDSFIASGSTFTFYYLLSNPTLMLVDFFEGGRMPGLNGTFLSQTFDTALSTPSWLQTTPTLATNGHIITFQTQSSDDGASFDSLVSWSTSSNPTSAHKRYVRYKITMSTQTGGTENPYVDDVTLAARESIGTFTSNIFDGSTFLSSWNTFITGQSGEGTLAHSYRTNASSTAITSAAFTTITSGSDISGSDRYIQWKTTFSVTSSSQNPTLESVTINYTQSAGSLQPMDSIVFNDEYWLAYTPTGETNNSKILVMNNEGAFSTFDGLDVYGFTVSNSKLLGGDSITDGSTGGYVRQLEIGDDDDGTAVQSEVTLRHNSLDPYSDYVKNLSIVYFDYAVDAGTFTTQVIRDFSSSPESYTVQFGTGTTYNRWKIETNQQSGGKTFALKFANTYPGTRMKIYPPITYHFEKTRLIPQR